MNILDSILSKFKIQKTIETPAFGKKKIIVCGDSFADGVNDDSWIKQLANNNNWNIESFGTGGSGPIHAIAQFFKYTDLGGKFDIALFCWSEPNRFYHHLVSDLNHHSSFYPELRHHHDKKSKKIYDASAQYLKEIYRDDIGHMQLSGVQHWFDQYLVKTYPDKMFLHFHCFSATHDLLFDDKFGEGWTNIDNHYINYIFKSGTTMYPPLMYLSANDPAMEGQMFGSQADWDRTGHLSPEQHTYMVNRMQQLIDSDEKPETFFISDDATRVKHVNETWPGRWIPKEW